jgi:hypothetical protein
MKVTVKDMIKSLQKFPEDSFVEIAITQYNKRYPVAWVNPSESAMVDGAFATMRDGKTVRIEARLPRDGNKFMFVSERKTK